jgi:hypothetical protein
VRAGPAIEGELDQASPQRRLHGGALDSVAPQILAFHVSRVAQERHAYNRLRG